MTVSELMTLLSAFPPDARVVVTGYEAGYDEPTPPKLVDVRFDVNVTEDRSWAGRHAAGSGDTAVHIGRAEGKWSGETARPA